MFDSYLNIENELASDLWLERAQVKIFLEAADDLRFVNDLLEIYWCVRHSSDHGQKCSQTTGEVNINRPADLHIYLRVVKMLNMKKIQSCTTVLKGRC